MPSIELTENLRSTLKEFRKRKKKRGDDLSKEIGKGASYISQIENGKIKEIDFNLLDQIFRKIIELPEDQYYDFIENLLTDVSTHMTNEELQHEEWMHQFNHEIRKYPITDELISFIQNKLNELGTTPIEFIAVINQNRGMENSTIKEKNKLQIEIIDCGNGRYNVISSILFEFPSDFIENILNKKITFISYINMEGILYNLLISSGLTSKDAHIQTQELLYDNKFYTIQERNKLINEKIKEKEINNEDFTFYDIQPTDFDKQYLQIRQDIFNKLNALRDYNIKYACENLSNFQTNLHTDLGFTVAVMSAPLTRIPTKELRKEFLAEYFALIQKYTDSASSEASQYEE